MAGADVRPPLPAVPAMASRWRRRPVCRLDDVPVALTAVSAIGATVETDLRPPLGSRVTLDHPEAGTITGEVCSSGRTSIRIAFAGDAQAMGFALAALAADMSAPRR